MFKLSIILWASYIVVGLLLVVATDETSFSMGYYILDVIYIQILILIVGYFVKGIKK